MKLELPSILITDDDLRLRETLRGVFEPEGFRTLTASDGEEALEIVQTNEVHLLMVDLHMPRFGGLDTIRLIRQRRLELPCILMSAEADRQTVEEVQRWQPVSFLPKPIKRLNMIEAVRAHLRHCYNWTV